MQDLQIIFSIPDTTQRVFDAITQVIDWWLERLDGRSTEIGDEFVYQHGNLHYSRHRLIEVIPTQRIVWLTIESRLILFES